MDAQTKTTIISTIEQELIANVPALITSIKNNLAAKGIDLDKVDADAAIPAQSYKEGEQPAPDFTKETP